MDDTRFHLLVDAVFLEIEDRVDGLSHDIDIDASMGVLTFTFEDGGTIILSRQVASREIWIAAKSGGYRLKFDNENWICTATDEHLKMLIDRIFFELDGSRPFT